MTEVDPNATAFAELDGLLEKSQYRAATKKADEILKSARGDVDALRCKAFALLSRSKFSEVLSVTSGMADEELKFYGAYANYKMNNFSDALKQITSLRNQAKAEAALELKGQILYKQGNFNQAKLTFEQCISQYKVNSEDVKTNLLAALAGSGRSEQMETLMEKYSISGEEGFEITFNRACNVIAMGKYEMATELLELAMRAGQESLLDEDLSQEEVDVELLPVTVQLGYVRALRGMEEDFVRKLTEAASKPGIGPSIKCVVENNLLALRSLNFSEHPPKRLLYESAKKLERMKAASPVSLLSPAQRILVGCNQALLLISLNHMEDAAPLVEQLLDDEPDHETVKMTQAVMLTKQNKLHKASEILQEIIAKHKTLVLGPMLFRAQLLCAGGSSKEALKLLTAIDDEKIKFMGSMVATKIALMEQVSDYSGCCALLDETLEWWKRQAASHDATADIATAWCLEKYADLKLKQGDLASGFDYCKRALEVERDELRRYQLISKFTRIIASGDLQQEFDSASLMPEGPALVEEDVDDLEGNIKGVRRGEISSKKQQMLENGQVKKKRKRKPRHPKGFDPENPGPMPDPERWLPKWQRSGYRKKQHGRKKDAVKGSQGAGKVDESLDRALHKSEASTSRPATSTGRTGPRRKGPRR